MNESAKIGIRDGISAEVGLTKPKQANPEARDIANHIKNISKSHDDFTANVSEVVQEAISVLDERARELANQTDRNNEEIRAIQEANAAKAKEQEHIFSQINRLKKLFD